MARTTLLLFLSFATCFSPSIASSSPGARLTLSSNNFRISYPAHSSRKDANDALGALESARSNVNTRLAAASVTPPDQSVIEAYVYETTGDFVGATGEPPWVAASTHGSRIALQPLSTLRLRGILFTTLRHEYVHTMVEALGHGRAPRWLAEGLCIYISGEGRAVNGNTNGPRLSVDELESRLSNPQGSAQETRGLYAAAYREVAQLVQAKGELGVWRQVAAY
jgi:hypothetical protein